MKIALNASIADLCHQGHLNLYSKMKGTGKKVIVILHDDNSCYRIKGKFPIQTLEHRMRNVGNCGYVDEVLATYSDDPAEMFEQVIQTYGATEVEYYRGDDLRDDFLGKWLLDKYNIKINYLPYTKGVSSTQIREEICR